MVGVSVTKLKPRCDLKGRSCDNRQESWKSLVLKVKVLVTQLYRLFVTPWTIPHRAPLSMEFSRKNTGVGCHSLLQGIFLTGIKPKSPAWQAESLQV